MLLFTCIVFTTFMYTTQQPSLKQQFTQNAFIPSTPKPETAAITEHVPPKIAILTYITSAVRDTRGLTYWNMHSYATRHNYTLIDAATHPQFQTEWQANQNQGKAIHYMKFFALSLYMNEYDWIMWADADAIFLNFNQTIAHYTDNDYDMILTSAPPTDKKWFKIINGGHMLFRNTPWLRDWLEKIYKIGMTPCKASSKGPLNGWLSTCNSGSYWLSDQGAMMQYFEENPEEACHVKYTNFRAFNSEYPWYENGDMIVHFPGKSTKERTQLINLFYEKADFSNGVVRLDDIEARELLTPKLNNDHSLASLASYDTVNQKCSSSIRKNVGS